GVAVGDVTHLAPASDLRHVVEQDDLHARRLLLGRHVRQQGHRASTLDGVGELTLMAPTAARDAPRNDLAALGDEAAQTTDVLVVDEADLVCAELANFSPPESAT